MANGLFDGGDGTASNPFLVSDGYDFLNIRNNLSAYYKQVKSFEMVLEIDYSDPDNPDEIPFETIKGPNNEPFSGVYDGQRHVISGLYLMAIGNDYDTYNLIFHEVTGTIKNLKISGSLGIVNMSGNIISPFGKCRNAIMLNVKNAMATSGYMSKAPDTGIAMIASGPSHVSGCSYEGFCYLSVTMTEEEYDINPFSEIVVAGIALDATHISKCSAIGNQYAFGVTFVGIGSCWVDHKGGTMGTVYDSYSTCYTQYSDSVYGISLTKAERCIFHGQVAFQNKYAGISLGPAKDCFNLSRDLYYVGSLNVDYKANAKKITFSTYENCYADSMLDIAIRF